MRNRAQTPEDFVIGVSILLLTVTGSLVFVQVSVFGTFDPAGESTSTAQADRVATHIVENYSTADSETTLRYNRSDGSGVKNQLNGDPDLTDLREKTGLNVSTVRRTSPEINVTIVGSDTLVDAREDPALDNGTRLAWGPNPSNVESPGRVVRVVRLENDGNDVCDPVCWLVVRVW